MSAMAVGTSATRSNVAALPAHHWWAAIVHYFTAAPGVVTAETGDRLIPRRYPPKNYAYLQDAAMKRAMERL